MTDGNGDDNHFNEGDYDNTRIVCRESTTDSNNFIIPQT